MARVPIISKEQARDMVKFLLEESGLYRSLYELSQTLNINAKTVHRWKTGESAIANAIHAQRLTQCFNMAVKGAKMQAVTRQSKCDTLANVFRGAMSGYVMDTPLIPQKNKADVITGLNQALQESIDKLPPAMRHH
jgi:hypothetical protein